MTNHTAADSSTLTLTVTEVPRPEDNHGTVVTFSGIAEDGENYFFAVDHRPAAALLYILGEDGEVTVEIEPWQIVARGAF